MRKIVVMSGVNLTEGGPLSIMQDAVRAFIRIKNERFHLILLVNSKNLFLEFHTEDIEFKEYQYPKKNWFFRLWFEYVHSYFISRKLGVYLWFCMHDITANVKAYKKVVYCQNPAPFYKLSVKEAYLEKSLFFFKYFYNLFYRFNISSNTYVVVQQDWFRNKFNENFSLNNVIVAHPDISLPLPTCSSNNENQPKLFFYPALPRVFKNFEILFEAAEKLNKLSINFQIIVTLKGNENKYAIGLFAKYKHINQIKFIGVQNREDIWKLYQQCDCLVFPSKMETWGLPITEFKAFEKPIIAARLPYAIETVGDYNAVKFFDPGDNEQLYLIMKSMIEGEIIVFDKPGYQDPVQPFASSWDELFELIV